MSGTEAVQGQDGLHRHILLLPAEPGPGISRVSTFLRSFQIFYSAIICVALYTRDSVVLVSSTRVFSWATGVGLDIVSPAAFHAAFLLLLVVQLMQLSTIGYVFFQLYRMSRSADTSDMEQDGAHRSWLMTAKRYRFMASNVLILPALAMTGRLLACPAPAFGALYLQCHGVSFVLIATFAVLLALLSAGVAAASAAVECDLRVLVHSSTRDAGMASGAGHMLPRNAALEQAIVCALALLLGAGPALLAPVATFILAALLTAMWMAVAATFTHLSTLHRRLAIATGAAVLWAMCSGIAAALSAGASDPIANWHGADSVSSAALDNVSSAQGGSDSGLWLAAGSLLAGTAGAFGMIVWESSISALPLSACTGHAHLTLWAMRRLALARTNALRLEAETVFSGSARTGYRGGSILSGATGFSSRRSATSGAVSLTDSRGRLGRGHGSKAGSSVGAGGGGGGIRAASSIAGPSRGQFGEADGTSTVYGADGAPATAGEALTSNSLLVLSGGQVSSRLRAVALAEVRTAISNLQKRFPRSPRAAITSALFWRVGTLSASTFHELRILSRAMRRTPSSDVRLVVMLRRATLAVESTSQLGDSGSQTASFSGSRRLAYDRLSRSLRTAEVRAGVAVTHTWQLLLESVPDLGSLHRLANEYGKHRRSATWHYERMLELAPGSASLLRRYAAFASRHLFDEGLAEQLHRRADKLDDAAEDGAAAGTATRVREFDVGNTLSESGNVWSAEQYAGDSGGMASILTRAGSQQGGEGEAENVAVLIVNLGEWSTGEIAEVNSAACRLLGRSRADLVASNITRVLPQPLHLLPAMTLPSLAEQSESVLNSPRAVLLQHATGALIPAMAMLQEALPASGRIPDPRFTILAAAVRADDCLGMGIIGPPVLATDMTGAAARAVQGAAFVWLAATQDLHQLLGTTPRSMRIAPPAVDELLPRVASALSGKDFDALMDMVGQLGSQVSAVLGGVEREVVVRMQVLRRDGEDDEHGSPLRGLAVALAAHAAQDAELLGSGGAVLSDDLAALIDAMTSGGVAVVQILQPDHDATDRVHDSDGESSSSHTLNSRTEPLHVPLAKSSSEHNSVSALEPSPAFASPLRRDSSNKPSFTSRGDSRAERSSSRAMNEAVAAALIGSSDSSDGGGGTSRAFGEDFHAKQGPSAGYSGELGQAADGNAAAAAAAGSMRDGSGQQVAGVQDKFRLLRRMVDGTDAAVLAPMRRLRQYLMAFVLLVMVSLLARTVYDVWALFIEERMRVQALAVQLHQVFIALDVSHILTAMSVWIPAGLVELPAAALHADLATSQEQWESLRLSGMQLASDLAGFDSPTLFYSMVRACDGLLNMGWSDSANCASRADMSLAASNMMWRYRHAPVAAATYDYTWDTTQDRALSQLIVSMRSTVSPAMNASVFDVAFDLVTSAEQQSIIQLGTLVVLVLVLVGWMGLQTCSQAKALIRYRSQALLTLVSVPTKQAKILHERALRHLRELVDADEAEQDLVLEDDFDAGEGAADAPDWQGAAGQPVQEQDHADRSESPRLQRSGTPRRGTRDRASSLGARRGSTGKMNANGTVSLNGASPVVGPAPAALPMRQRGRNRSAGMSELSAMSAASHDFRVGDQDGHMADLLSPASPANAERAPRRTSRPGMPAGGAGGVESAAPESRRRRASRYRVRTRGKRQAVVDKSSFKRRMWVYSLMPIALMVSIVVIAFGLDVFVFQTGALATKQMYVAHGIMESLSDSVIELQAAVLAAPADPLARLDVLQTKLQRSGGQANISAVAEAVAHGRPSVPYLTVNETVAYIQAKLARVTDRIEDTRTHMAHLLYGGAAQFLTARQGKFNIYLPDSLPFLSEDEPLYPFFMLDACAHVQHTPPRPIQNLPTRGAGLTGNCTTYNNGVMQLGYVHVVTRLLELVQATVNDCNQTMAEMRRTASGWPAYNGTGQPEHSSVASYWASLAGDEGGADTREWPRWRVNLASLRHAYHVATSVEGLAPGASPKQRASASLARLSELLEFWHLFLTPSTDDMLYSTESDTLSTLSQMRTMFTTVVVVATLACAAMVVAGLLPALFQVGREVLACQALVLAVPPKLIRQNSVVRRQLRIMLRLAMAEAAHARRTGKTSAGMDDSLDSAAAMAMSMPDEARRATR